MERQERVDKAADGQRPGVSRGLGSLSHFTRAEHIWQR